MVFAPIATDQFYPPYDNRNLELEYKLLKKLTDNQKLQANLHEYHPDNNRLNRYQNLPVFAHNMVKGIEDGYQNCNHIQVKTVKRLY